MCARVLQNRHYTHKTIKIFSDSQAALKALESGWCNSKTVWNCREALSELSRCNKITLVWIPGHMGLGGNEAADQLAKRGAATKFTGPEPVLGISHATAKHATLAWAENEWKRQWQRLPGLRHSKVFITNPVNKQLTDKLLGLNRSYLKALVGLYTGHCRLRHHMHKIGLAPNSECRLCMEDEETAEHVLCTCPAAGRIRLNLFGEASLKMENLRNAFPDALIDFIKKLELLGEI